MTVRVVQVSSWQGLQTLSAWICSAGHGIDFHTLSSRGLNASRVATRVRACWQWGRSDVLVGCGRTPSSVEGGHGVARVRGSERHGAARTARHTAGLGRRARGRAVGRALPAAAPYWSLRAQAAALDHEWSPVPSSRAPAAAAARRESVLLAVTSSRTSLLTRCVYLSRT